MRNSTAKGRPWLRSLATAVLAVSCLSHPALSAVVTGNTTSTSSPPALAATAPKSFTVRLATYNTRNYVMTDRIVDGHFNPAWPKPEAEKAALRAVIRAAHADILALTEMGDAPYVEELRRDLAAEGLNYPFSAVGHGPDPDRHVAILSRLPIKEMQARENIPFKFNGQPAAVSRGLLEVTFNTNGQSWSLYVVHLKSRLTATSADPESAAQREGEARVLRDLIRNEQPLNAGALVAVVGDFNDTRDSAPVRRFLEVNNQPLLLPAPAVDSRGETWTLYYPRADQYEHSDYVLLSPALAPLQKGPGAIVDIPENKLASDHRLVWVDLVFPSKSAEKIPAITSPVPGQN